jgi:Holliday junction resolvase RusA-like endonuclease
VTKTGHAYYDEKTKEYRERVRQCAIVAQAGREPLTGALAMFVDCVLPIPASWPAHKKQAALHGQWHVLRPDSSNIIKGIEDSLNGIVYEDDSQISLLVGAKSYGTEPEAKVTIYQLNDLNNPRWMISNLKRQLAGCEV